MSNLIRPVLGCQEIPHKDRARVPKEHRALFGGAEAISCSQTTQLNLEVSDELSNFVNSL